MHLRPALDLAKVVADVERAAQGPLPTSLHLEHLAPASPPDEVLYDICGRLRSPATLRSFRLGQKPPNAGRKFPATPPTSDEIVRMLKACKNNPAGRRGKALMVIQWRSGLRVSEALDLRRHDLNPDNGTVFVANGKGSKSRLVGMDPWAFDQVQEWIDYRYTRYPDGPIVCVVQGPTKGERWSSSAARAFVHRVAHDAGVERRVAPHQFRHAHACEMAREGMQIHVVSRQLGHSNVGTTATYLAGISNEEVVSAIHHRPAPQLELVS